MFTNKVGLLAILGFGLAISQAKNKNAYTPPSAARLAAPSPAAPSPDYKLVNLNFAGVSGEAGTSILTADALAKVGIYSSTPLTLVEAINVGYGEPMPATGATRIVAGETSIFTPIYNEAGNLIAGWHPPGTTWDYTTYGWV